MHALQCDMLTRKQQWRRTSCESLSPRTACSKIRFESTLKKQGDAVMRIQSETGLPQKKCDEDKFTRRWTFNVTSCKSTPRQRHVRFSDTNHVILVPCRQEYFRHNMQEVIWWSEDDLREAKNSAREEVNDYRNSVCCDVHTAIRHLYQPIQVIQNKTNDAVLQPNEPVYPLVANVNFLEVKPKHGYVPSKDDSPVSEESTYPEPAPIHPLAYLVY